MTEIELKILGIMPDISETEKVIASYILDNLTDVLQSPIAELSERSGVSKTSWVRFCKTLGYTGLKDLKRAFALELNSNVVRSRLNFDDVNPVNDLRGACHHIEEVSIQSIRDTMCMLDYEMLETVGKRIQEARTVKIFGVGASGVVAKDLLYKLLRIGLIVDLHEDFHLQLTAAATIDPRDVAIFISHSGRTTEIIEMMRIAKETGATTVAITRYGMSELSTGCDYALYTSTPELEKRSGAMSSRIAQLVLIDVLFTTIARFNYDNVQKRLETTYTYCGKHKVSAEK